MSIVSPEWYQQQNEIARKQKAKSDAILAEMQRNTWLVALALAVLAYLVASKSTQGYRVAYGVAAGLIGYVAAGEYYGKKRNELLLQTGQVTVGPLQTTNQFPDFWTNIISY
jgi:hypothetical protein